MRVASALLVGLPVLWFAVNLIDVHRVGRSDQAVPADAIVVLGAAQYDGRPSPQLAARLDHVVDLWARGLAPVVVTTGGKRPDDRFTEAAASAAYLEDRGVPAAAIVQVGGSTSFESIRAAAGALAARMPAGSMTVRVVLVSDPFHSLRIRLIAEEVGLDACVSPTRTSPVRGRRAWRRELGEAAGVAVGRLIGFGRLSDLVG
ncbi:MAG: YdcF family protein [Ilumatobacteraceae bacterium]